MSKEKANFILDFMSMQVQIDKQILEMFTAVTDIFDEDIEESMQLLDEIAEKIENTRKSLKEYPVEGGNDLDTSFSYR
ncbi:MAG: hypothetical protein ACTSPB_01555 [Candidatus Thorarchaeota archaeon]|nr:MAG: hypothetical protein DRO54_04530 [Candidatus Bathyarchaeota archaeon]